VGEPLLFPDDPHIVAIATDAEIDTPLPQLDINDPQSVADFIIDYIDSQPQPQPQPQPDRER
jgi:molybdopterin-guanine dinucleotide biosynthesis protein B